MNPQLDFRKMSSWHRMWRNDGGTALTANAYAGLQGIHDVTKVIDAMREHNWCPLYCYETRSVVWYPPKEGIGEDEISTENIRRAYEEAKLGPYPINKGKVSWSDASTLIRVLNLKGVWIYHHGKCMYCGSPRIARRQRISRRITG